MGLGTNISGNPTVFVDLILTLAAHPFLMAQLAEETRTMPPPPPSFIWPWLNLLCFGQVGSCLKIEQ